MGVGRCCKGGSMKQARCISLLMNPDEPDRKSTGPIQVHPDGEYPISKGFGISAYRFLA